MPDNKSLPLIEQASRTFNTELPESPQNMEQHLDWLIPEVRPYSEDLREKEFFIGTRWLQITDRDDHQEAVLHIFMEPDEYLYSLNGDLSKGKWRVLEETNTFIWDRTGKVSELYDLAFLSPDFFILKKHGGGQKSDAKYFVLGKEKVVKGLTWLDAMQLLYNSHRSNNLFMLMVFVVGAIFVAILIFSLLK